MTMTVSRLGDRALRCAVADLAEAHSLAASLRTADIPGVADIVPAWQTVTVCLADNSYLDEVAQLITSLQGEVRPSTRVEHVIDIRYDGADLDAVADHTGLSRQEVVRRHADASYLVAFLGFAPGFAYLSGLDPALATPRLATPRTRVPAGSVGIAGDVTGIYPRALPGGWQLIGTTDVVLFNSDHEPPNLLSAGDLVRFRVDSIA